MAPRIGTRETELTDDQKCALGNPAHRYPAFFIERAIADALGVDG